MLAEVVQHSSCNLVAVVWPETCTPAGTAWPLAPSPTLTARCSREIGLRLCFPKVSGLILLGRCPHLKVSEILDTLFYSTINNT